MKDERGGHPLAPAPARAATLLLPLALTLALLGEGWVDGAAGALGTVGTVALVLVLRTTRRAAPVSEEAREAARGLHVTVVFNPSKADDPQGRKEEVLAVLSEHDLQVRWLETSVEDPGALMCRGALEAGTDLVLACGGDGTVMACATAVAGTDVPLAVIPSGTGNLLSQHLALPTPLREAVEVALHGARRDVDVGWCEGRAFLVMAGMGFDAQMVRDAPPELKRRAGWLAYGVSGLKHVNGRNVTFTVTVDGVTVRRRGRSVLVANIGTLAGGLVLLPEAKLDDGLLDVAILSPGGLTGWVQLAAAVVLRRGDRSGKVTTLRGRDVVVRSSRPLPYELDGDDFEERTELHLTVRPGALTIASPR